VKVKFAIFDSIFKLDAIFATAPAASIYLTLDTKMFKNDSKNLDNLNP
jgi:hypothetical protein